MGLSRYGVLKGRPMDWIPGRPHAPHFHILVEADDQRHRVSVNTRSEQWPSDLLYVEMEPLDPALTVRLEKLPEGFTELPRMPASGALDYLRGNLFPWRSMRALPSEKPGEDNDLNEFLEARIRRAILDPDGMIYAFGEPWGPEPRREDAIFGFRPGQGIHNVHMNQGNRGRWMADDGVWQDGALIIHDPDGAQDGGVWTGLFLAFQSQARHTDDRTGHNRFVRRQRRQRWHRDAGETEPV